MWSALQVSMTTDVGRDGFIYWNHSCLQKEAGPDRNLNLNFVICPEIVCWKFDIKFTQSFFFFLSIYLRNVIVELIFISVLCLCCDIIFKSNHIIKFTWMIWWYHNPLFNALYFTWTNKENTVPSLRLTYTMRVFMLFPIFCIRYIQ